MHSKQIVSSQAAALPTNSVNDGRPVLLRDALTLLPLGDAPGALAHISSHIGKGVPEPKHVIERGHTAKNTRDKLSGQGGTTLPVTKQNPKRTMCPMGSRATTPKAFKEEFAKRLRAARELKYQQASDFAAELGIPANTYGKYESGRSLLPHHLIPKACDLLGIEVRSLFEYEKKAFRKTG